MARSGQTVNLEELKMGLMLSPLKAKDEDSGGFQLSTLMEEGEGEGDTQADIDAMDESEIPDPGEVDFEDDEMESESSLFEEEPVDVEADLDGEDEQLDDEDEEANYTIHTASSMSPGLAPQLSPLKETSGNSRATVPSPPEQKRDREGFSTIVEENTYDLLQLASPKKQQSAKSTPRSQHTPNTNTYPNSNTNSLSTPPDEISLLKTSFPPPSLQPQSRSRTSSPTKSSKPAMQPRLTAQSTPRLGKSNESRLPRPREQPPMQSPLTMASIAAKLAASEREADAARVRAKIKAARANRQLGGSAWVSGKENSKENSREKEERKLMPPPPTPKRDITSHTGIESSAPKPDLEAIEGDENGNVNEGRSRKRKARDLGAGNRGQGKASRRRSTLSPWELESLILGGAGISPGK